jgi:adenylosuccinate synthase
LAPKIVLISGPICSGKTTLSNLLVKRFGLLRICTRNLLKERFKKTSIHREELQRLGEELDRKTKGRWVGEELVKYINSNSLNDQALVVVDSIRIRQQDEAIRKLYPNRVLHIHLIAPEKILSIRYDKKRKEYTEEEFGSYQETRQSRTEREVGDLIKISDLVINTDRCTENDVLTQAASFIGLYGNEYLRLVDVLIGGQYGSEGKGHIASYLAKDYNILVRVGGPNAGHTVIHADKSIIKYHHLPSGTSANEGAKLIIGPGATIYVPTLMKEIAQCNVESHRLSIDPQAMIISEADIKAERRHLANTISSTAQGVGWATARRVRDRGTNSVKLARDDKVLRPFVRPTIDILDKAFFKRERVFIEGTQGTGLSIFHGNYPYVTSRDTTVAGCLSESGISPSRVRKVIMVCRRYPIRVQNPKGGGTSGPMTQEINLKEVHRRSGVSYTEILKTEKTTTTGRRRRIAEFDWNLLRKAASLNAPSDIALTFADYEDVRNREARRFDQLTQDTINFIEDVEKVACAPVSLISTRFHPRSIIDRRSWGGVI